MTGDEWVIPEDYPEFQAQWNAVFDGRSNRIECAYRSGRPGAYRYFELRAEALLLPGGRERTVTGVIWEVTRLELVRHQLLDANLLFQEMMAHLECYVYLKNADRDLSYVYCNDRMCKFFNRPKNAIIGHTDDEIVIPELAEQYRRNDRELLRTGGTQIFYEEIQDADRGRRQVRLLKCAFRSASGEMLVLGLGVDVTDWKIAPDEWRAGRANALDPDHFQASENS